MSKFREYLNKVRMMNEDALFLDLKDKNQSNSEPEVIQSKDNKPVNRAFNQQIKEKIEEYTLAQMKKGTTFKDFLIFLPKQLEQWLRGKLFEKTITIDLSPSYENLVNALKKNDIVKPLKEVGVNGTEIEILYDYENVFAKGKGEIEFTIQLSETFKDKIKGLLGK